MELQIDIKPADRHGMHKVSILVDGYCHTLTATNGTVNDMVRQGLVDQVRGRVRDEYGRIQTFNYHDNVDGAGVQYTSPCFLLGIADNK